ncbi:MAG TPA: leucine zipper domain-containing protein [Planctomycetota bacterium]|nr:leucine zipper domain-containing protein [Planctomycetota bacterium]
MSDIRLAFVHLVRTLKKPVSAACREFGISRKTGYKWLKRFDADRIRPLLDHSRRPRSSPAQTAAATEQRVLDVRDRYGWGPRKIRAHFDQS